MKRDKNMVALYVDKDTVNIYKASLDLHEALKRFLDSSACQNDCDPDDMSCDTSFARKVIAKAEEK